VIPKSTSSAGVLICWGGGPSARGLCFGRVSLQALLTKASSLRDHVAMAFLLVGDALVALLLTLEQGGGAFGRNRGLAPGIVAHFRSLTPLSLSARFEAFLAAGPRALDGKVIGACMSRHRHREFLRFLKQIDKQTAADLDLHLIVDNYATHKTPAVKRWLKVHPRFHLHFTPTSASWLNMVERFFAEITRKRIRRGVFKSVDELESAIMEYLENHNADPKPFIWTKSAGEILEKVARAKQAVESQH
jgi:transposase